MENSDEVVTPNFLLTLLYSNSFQQKYFGVYYPLIKLKANNTDFFILFLTHLATQINVHGNVSRH